MGRAGMLGGTMGGQPASTVSTPARRTAILLLSLGFTSLSTILIQCLWEYRCLGFQKVWDPERSEQCNP